MESMQVKIDVAEVRLTELTAELLRMTNEIQLVKVLPTDFSLQMEKRMLPSLKVIPKI